MFVYETLLRPWIVKHEPQIEEKLEKIRSKSGELLMFYIKNFTSKGQSMVLEVIHYIISHAQSKTQNKPVSPTEVCTVFFKFFFLITFTIILLYFCKFYLPFYGQKKEIKYIYIY